MPTVITGTDGINQVQTGAVESGDLFSGFRNGITHITDFKLSATFTPADSNGVIDTSNIEEITESTIGPPVTVSNGIFTFPTEGIWSITAEIVLEGSGDNYGGISTEVNFGSGYESYNTSYGGQNTSTDGSDFVGSTCFIKVNNASNTTARFSADSMVDLSYRGQPDYKETGFTFIRLGDT